MNGQKDVLKCILIDAGDGAALTARSHSFMAANQTASLPNIDNCAAQKKVSYLSIRGSAV